MIFTKLEIKSQITKLFAKYSYLQLYPRLHLLWRNTPTSVIPQKSKYDSAILARLLHHISCITI